MKYRNNVEIENCYVNSNSKVKWLWTHFLLFLKVFKSFELIFWIVDETYV